MKYKFELDNELEECRDCPCCNDGGHSFCKLDYDIDVTGKVPNNCPLVVVENG